MSEQRHQKHERLSRIRTRDFHTNIPSLCSRSHLHSPFSHPNLYLSVCVFPFPTFLLSNSISSNEFSLDWLAVGYWLVWMFVPSDCTASLHGYYMTYHWPCCTTTHTRITIQPCSHSLSSSLLWLWLVYARKNVYCNVHFHPSHMSPSALLHKPKQFMEDNYGNGIIVVDSMEALSSHSSRNLIIVSWSPFLFHRYSLHKILRAFLCSALEGKSGNLFLNCW